MYLPEDPRFYILGWMRDPVRENAEKLHLKDFQNNGILVSTLFCDRLGSNRDRIRILDARDSYFEWRFSWPFLGRYEWPRFGQEINSQELAIWIYYCVLTRDFEGCKRR